MYSRLHNHTESAPCPLCETTKSENLKLQIQLDACHDIIAQQLELLRDLTFAADAAEAYLADLGFSEDDEIGGSNE